MDGVGVEGLGSKYLGLDYVLRSVWSLNWQV